MKATVPLMSWTVSKWMARAKARAERTSDRATIQRERRRFLTRRPMAWELWKEIQVMTARKMDAAQ